MIQEKQEMADKFLAMIAGEDIVLFGKPVHCEVTWPQGRPWGMTDEQIRERCANWLAERRHERETRKSWRRT